MNNKNIEKINSIIPVLEMFQCAVEKILMEEQATFNKLSESYQNSERGEERQEKLDALQAISDNLEEAVGNCYTFVE